MAAFQDVFNKFKEEELNKVNEYYMNNEIISQNLLEKTNNIILNTDKGENER